MVLVSVLMPNFNGGKFIREAIESILTQTFKNFELLILDDCSSDNSWEIIEEYARKDKRIRAFRNDKNLGIVQTRNKLFSLVNKNSKYFAIMDSDDVSLPQRLKLQVEFLEKNNKIGILGSNIIIIDENSEIIGKRIYNSEPYSMRFIKSPFAQPSVIIRRDVLSENRYSKEFEVAEDWDLWIRLMMTSNGFNIQDFLIKYRISMTQSKNSKLKKTIINGIKIRFKYMKFRDYFNIKVLFRIFGEVFLLLLPSFIVIGMFKRIEFRK